MASGEVVCCIYTPFDKDTIGWALSRVEPERGAKTGPFTPEDIAVLKREALKTGSMFNEPFRTIVDATDPATTFIRPVKEKHAFQHESRLRGVVFIVDANHVLSKYEFIGANLALKDGWDLAEQVCRNSSLEAVIGTYDKLSVPRAEHTIKHRHERIGFGHSTGSSGRCTSMGWRLRELWQRRDLEQMLVSYLVANLPLMGLFQSPYG
jgi:2-polyprenyl-6-methoxyphenol hydroxylase-like FAD-dependent oxidoreductase